MIAMIAISLLNALFVNCHNLSITLKCFALFSLHCTVLTITKVTPCVRITCTSPLPSWHHFTSISYNLLACYCQILVCLLSLERESSRERSTLPCRVALYLKSSLIKLLKLLIFTLIFIAVLFTLRILWIWNSQSVLHTRKVSEERIVFPNL